MVHVIWGLHPPTYMYLSSQTTRKKRAIQRYTERDRKIQRGIYQESETQRNSETEIDRGTAIERQKKR